MTRLCDDIIMLLSGAALTGLGLLVIKAVLR